jgi:hypothetical protein
VVVVLGRVLVVVVVVGGVVVVDGSVVVVEPVDSEGAPGSDVGVVAGGEVVVDEVLGVDVVGESTGTLWEGALVPGCSLDTTTPMAMDAPVATRTAERVRRRSRTSARRLFSGELEWRTELIRIVLEPPSVHGSVTARCRAERPLWVFCESLVGP